MNKKVLFITWDVPYPASTGGKKATLSIIMDKLPERHSIILVLNSKNEDMQAARDFFSAKNIRIESVIPQYAGQKKLFYILNYFKSFVSLKPHYSKKYIDQNIINRIDQMIRQHNIQEIYFNSVIFCELFLYLKKRYENIKFDLVVHNLEYVVLREHSGIHENFLIRLLFKLESLKMFFYERKMFRRFDSILFVSLYDAQKISGWLSDGKPEIEIWNQKLYSAKKINHRGGGGYLLFPGSVDFAPNMHGLLWFCRHVYDKLMKRYPGLKIYVTGYCCQKNMNAFKKWNNIVFQGYVDDKRMMQLYQECICVISPIHKGSGVKIKVLDARNSNIPVVMTRFSARGIVLENIHVEKLDNSPESFYNNLVKVIEGTVGPDKA